MPAPNDAQALPDDTKRWGDFRVGDVLPGNPPRRIIKIDKLPPDRRYSDPHPRHRLHFLDGEPFTAPVNAQVSIRSLSDAERAHADFLRIVEAQPGEWPSWPDSGR